MREQEPGNSYAVRPIRSYNLLYLLVLSLAHIPGTGVGIRLEKGEGAH